MSKIKRKIALGLNGVDWFERIDFGKKMVCHERHERGEKNGFRGRAKGRVRLGL